jgi:pre-mRNA-processing factor SLU7
MKAQELEEQRAEQLLSMDERSRPYNHAMKHSYSEPTEEEIEAYQMKKRNREDPMADFLAK